MFSNDFVICKDCLIKQKEEEYYDYFVLHTGFEGIPEEHGKME